MGPRMAVELILEPVVTVEVQGQADFPFAGRYRQKGMISTRPYYLQDQRDETDEMRKEREADEKAAKEAAEAPAAAQAKARKSWALGSRKVRNVVKVKRMFEEDAPRPSLSKEISGSKDVPEELRSSASKELASQSS